MSDFGTYGRTENVGAMPMATANSLAGTAVGASTPNSVVGSPAMMSTAPYVPPKPAHPQGDERLCRTEGCRGIHLVDSDFCRHHQPEVLKEKAANRGKRCAKDDCRGWPKKGDEFCRHHAGK